MFAGGNSIRKIRLSPGGQCGGVARYKFTDRLKCLSLTTIRRLSCIIIAVLDIYGQGVGYFEVCFDGGETYEQQSAGFDLCRSRPLSFRESGM